MRDLGLTLVAAADDPIRTYYELGRLQSMTDWWHWMVLLVGCVLVVAYLVWMYRRDGIELPRGVRYLLLTLRVLAFAGLLVFFFNLEKRTERRIVKPSRVAVLVDTSQSMGLPESESAPDTTRRTRLEAVIESFTNDQLLESLQDKHEVMVYRFDQTSMPEPLATLPQLKPNAERLTNQTSQQQERTSAVWGYRLAALLVGLAILAVILHILPVPWFRGAEGEAWALLAAGILLSFGLVIAAVTNLRHPEFPWRVAFGGAWPDSVAPLASDTSVANDEATSATTEPVPVWRDTLLARGSETRVGDAIRMVLERERGGPLAGIVVFTDGRNNAGVDPESVARLAQEAEVPIYPVGLGSERSPRNVAILDLEAPARVYPGDDFSVTGYVQSSGLEGRTVQLELLTAAASADPSTATSVDQLRLTLGPDGTIQTAKFTVTPETIGKRNWILRAQALNDESDPGDNQRVAPVEVVERKNRVLLMAGGPMRDYRFLRNLLFRDQNTTLDVLLQSALPGAAQEADQVLLDFPSTPEEMFEYDCVVAFDPDWQLLTSEQIGLLDQWVAEKGGGLVLVAGPVNTPRWSRSRSADAGNAKLTKVKALYPVTFYSRGSASLQLSRTNSDSAWPLEFTDDGKLAQFLWLADSPTENELAWSRFPGVFGYQAIRDLKPGATAYARFSDPQASASDELPVYIAGQFYGGGRVLFLASGELWRLRSIEDHYFDTFYTKVIRHVSQGRLLRDSSRGMLLVDRERASLGEAINIRATLSDNQYQPLTQPAVTATLLSPGGERTPLVLRQITNAEREGMYSGQFTSQEAGDYRIELPIPGVDDDLLTRDVRVRIPTLEVESPQRNDAVLASVAAQTQGAYFVGMDAALGRGGTPSVAQQVLAKDQETFLPSTPDRRFEERLMTWLLALICGALSIEWLVRRLYKLA